MSGVTGAVIGGAVIAGGASIAGGLINKSAAGDAAAAQVSGADAAAQAQLQATRESIQAQQQMADKAAGLYSKYADQARADLAPFRQSQLNALQQASALTDPNNPLYQQQRQQNTQAIQRQLAAQGLLRSKKQSDLLTNLELGLDQQRANQINALANTGAAQSLAGISQGLGSQLGALYGNLGQSIGSSYQQQGASLANIYTGRGNAIAGGLLGQAQATAGMVTGIGNTVQGSIGNYLDYGILSQLSAAGDTSSVNALPLSQQIAKYRLSIG